jgi:hypothetical protein
MKNPGVTGFGIFVALGLVGIVSRAPLAAQGPAPQTPQINGSMTFPVERDEEEINELTAAILGLPRPDPPKPNDPPPPPPPPCKSADPVPCTDAGGEDSPTQDQDVIPIHGDSSSTVDEVLAPDADAEPPKQSGPSPDPFEGLTRGAVSPAARVSTLAAAATVIAQLSDGTIEMRVYSPRGLTSQEKASLLRVSGVLVPIPPAARQYVEQWIAGAAPAGSGVHLTRVALRGYCVESKKQPPVSGSMFMMGRSAVQQQFAPMRAVRLVSEIAASGGYLKPQGGTADYGRFITQYAIWTKLEHWDQARFTDEFLRRSKQSFKVEHRQWTRDSERTLRALAPQRWSDIQFVMRAADRVETELRHGGVE